MSQRRILTLSVLVYGVLGALGAAWCAFVGRPDVLTHPAPWLALEAPWGHAASLLSGAALAITTLALTRVFVRRTRWARDLHVGFHELLPRLGGPTILVLALTSGIGEEVFFRAALSPSLGWVLSAVIFGLVHIGPDRRFLGWTAWAVLMGLLLGAILEATGSLLGPILAHVWINHENLHFIVGFDPRGEKETDAPRLVRRRERR